MGVLQDFANAQKVNEALKKGVQGYDKAVKNKTDILLLDGKISSLTLGLHTDGLFYIFINNEPVGNGISLPKASGDVYGNVDSGNNIVLNGDLADGNYYIKYEMADGSTIDIGELVLGTTAKYTITNNLTNCKNSNNSTEITHGESYLATITANVGYEIESITVSMNGGNETVTNGIIDIENVTGDIIITATAKELPKADPVTVDIGLRDGIRLGSDGGDRTGATGYCATERIDLTNIPKPCTINLTKAKWAFANTSETGYIVTCARNASGTNLVTGYTNTSIGSGYFSIAVNNKDVVVTITSDEVAEICFSGQWSNTNYSDSNMSLAAANTKATLTYTPVA